MMDPATSCLVWRVARFQACNYDEEAINDGTCVFPEEGEIRRELLEDADGDNVVMATKSPDVLLQRL